MDKLNKSCCSESSPQMRHMYDEDMTKWSYVKCSSCNIRTRGNWASEGNDCPIFYSEIRQEWNDIFKPSIPVSELRAFMESKSSKGLIINMVAAKDLEDFINHYEGK